MKITIRDFEKMVNNRSMSVMDRRKIDGFNVWVSDGYDSRIKKYVTWYAVGLDPERLDIAQRLEFDKNENKNGLILPSQKQWRIEAAFQKAQETIPNIKRMPIYNGIIREKTH